jgi:Bacterial Ig-like domain (group 1)
MRRGRWLIAAAAAVVALAVPAVAEAGQSFLFLQSGFTQEVYGVSSSFMGGVAFAPDGDPWVDSGCGGTGTSLTRFDGSTTYVAFSTTLHPGTLVPSAAGCGLTNGANGNLFSNTGAGVVELDPNSGAQIGGPFGPGGDALGIAPDPQTGDLVYVGGNGTLFKVDEALTTFSTFSTVTTNNFVDGIAWDPTGNFLFLSNRSPSFRLTILDRNGNLVQHVSMTSEPDGISFHASPPKFVVTNNTDGTMTRFDFPADDFTQPPSDTVFASGGFRGDLSQVGTDGCIYLTQDGTRYDDGTTTSENSLVRICGGFAPPVVAANLTLSPKTATNTVGSQHCVTAHATNAANNPVANITIVFSVSGANSASGSSTTNSSGDAQFCYTGAHAGNDTIHAFADNDSSGTEDSGEPSDNAAKTWTPGLPASLTLTPKTASNVVDTQHCVTAHVEDELGEPTSGITVRFSVSGSVDTSGSEITDANGDATFCYQGPALPGADVITAYADTDNDNVQQANEPGDRATKEWVLPQSTPGCKATDGGRITAANGDSATFGSVAMVSARGTASGAQEYQDHGPAANLRLHSTAVLAVACNGKEASVFGTARIDGAGSVGYRIDLGDNGEPGVGTDTYRIRLSTGYDSGTQTLAGGNVQVH